MLEKSLFFLHFFFVEIRLLVFANVGDRKQTVRNRESSSHNPIICGLVGLVVEEVGQQFDGYFSC